VERIASRIVRVVCKENVNSVRKATELTVKVSVCWRKTVLIVSS
jgi:hypothetical protein